MGICYPMTSPDRGYSVNIIFCKFGNIGEEATEIILKLPIVDHKFPFSSGQRVRAHDPPRHAVKSTAYSRHFPIRREKLVEYHFDETLQPFRQKGASESNCCPRPGQP